MKKIYGLEKNLIQTVPTSLITIYMCVLFCMFAFAKPHLVSLDKNKLDFTVLAHLKCTNLTIFSLFFFSFVCWYHWSDCFQLQMR